MEMWICSHIKKIHPEIKVRHPKWFGKIISKIEFCPFCGEKEIIPKHNPKSIGDALINYCKKCHSYTETFTSKKSDNHFEGRCAKCSWRKY